MMEKSMGNVADGRTWQDDLHGELEQLADADNLRRLRSAQVLGKYVAYGGCQYINMSSNDYLGLGAETELQRRFLAALPDDRFLMSNPSSRLMTGNSGDYEVLEAALAALYPGKAPLVVGCGFMANSGVLPALTRKGDLILADKLVHASIIDGLRLCECEWRRFNHNDLNHLERLLRKMRGDYHRVWVVTESVFSMDGDRAPLQELVALKYRYDLQLYVDEAHAFGVYGPSGAGLSVAEGVDGEVDVLIGTFGKALASCGAFVAVDPLVREMLVNRMRTLIFSTALPPLDLMWTRFLVEHLPEFEPRRRHLQRLTEILLPGHPSATHIIPIITGENGAALDLAERFRRAGFWTTAVRWPTVPKGEARVRISLSAAISEEEVERFLTVWKNIG